MRMDNPASDRILAGMSTKDEILIVGSGLNGPALALALAQAGFAVTVIDALEIDPRENPDFDGRSYALALGSQRLLDGIG